MQGVADAVHDGLEIPCRALPLAERPNRSDKVGRQRGLGEMVQSRHGRRRPVSSPPMAA
jgi:hypothetical protein